KRRNESHWLLSRPGHESLEGTGESVACSRADKKTHQVLNFDRVGKSCHSFLALQSFFFTAAYKLYCFFNSCELLGSVMPEGFQGSRGDTGVMKFSGLNYA